MIVKKILRVFPVKCLTQLFPLWTKVSYASFETILGLVSSLIMLSTKTPRVSLDIRSPNNTQTSSFVHELRMMVAGGVKPMLHLDSYFWFPWIQ